MWGRFSGTAAATVLNPSLSQLTGLQILNLTGDHVDVAGATALHPSLSTLVRLLPSFGGHNGDTGRDYVQREEDGDYGDEDE